MPDKLVLFIDRQNVYNVARRAFFSDSDPHYFGQIDPIRLGNLICSRPPPDCQRQLHQVRIYKGEPDGNRDPKSYAAHIKQVNAWKKDGAEVITRRLLYRPNVKPQEKGIDVALAIDIVTMAVDGEYDVGVVASLDTDLKPALEYVIRRFPTQRRIEVMAWCSASARTRLSIKNHQIWCHYLDKTDYDSVADLTDYNR